MYTLLREKFSKLKGVLILGKKIKRNFLLEIKKSKIVKSTYARNSVLLIENKSRKSASVLKL
jgi:hypothetical protein